MFTGLSSAASSDVFQKLPKKYQSVFDVGGSESQLQDAFGAQSSSDKQFSPQNFGFIPTFSQGLSSDVPSQPNRYQQKSVEIERTKATAQSSAISRAPLQYNIKTKHDKNYKKQPEADLAGLGLSAYKEKPTYAPVALADYKSARLNDAPRIKNDDHLIPYKKYSFQQVPAAVPTYQALTATGYPAVNSYAQLPILDPKLFRAKRYSGNKKNQKLKKNRRNDEDEDGSSYGYHSDYNSRPKEFDESSRYTAPDFSGYDDDSDKKEYDYGSDEEYGSDEYERIKSLSEKQAAEVKQNPENCKKVQKDSMTCMVCQDPKTGGSYESCSYVSEPKNNKYAYVKAQKYDSNDEPEESDESTKSELKQKPETSQEIKASPVKLSSKIVDGKPVRGEIKFQPNVRKPQKLVQQPKYHSYYTHSQNPEPIDSSESNKYSAYKQSDKSDDYEEDEKDYESSIPEFFTDNEQKKNVEHVLAEFVKKDRSACKKVFKNHMTCYQCTDKNGLKHEECMFVSESAPKSSHLAYKEVKEFNSKPQLQNTNVEGNDEAESQVVTTSNPAPTVGLLSSTTEYPTFAPINLKKKQLFKKFTGQDEKKLANLQIPELTDGITTKFYLPEVPTIATKLEGPVKRNVKRSPTKQEQAKASEAKTPLDTSPSADSHLDNIANPADFSSEESKGAFWAETVPRYSKELGVSLPEYMLAKSEHEEFFDEFLTSGK